MTMRLRLFALLLLAACSEPRAPEGTALTKAGSSPGAALATTPSAQSAGTDLPDWGDLRLFANMDRLRWSQWETRVDGDRLARLRALGIQPLRTDSTGPREPPDPEYAGVYDPYGERALDFHFIDFSGDGVDDVIYDGAWFMQGDSAVGALDGSNIKFYQVMGGRAVQVMENHGSIQRIWKGGPGKPISFRTVYHGCCGEVHWGIDYFRPVSRGDTVRFEPYHHLLGREEMVMPTRFLSAPRRFTVASDRYLLRASPVIQATGNGDWTEGEGRGNAVAEYGRGARGTALAEQTDATGRVWWFVRMDGATPPVAAQVDAPWIDDKPVPADRLGWMSSRFLTPAP